MSIFHYTSWLKSVQFVGEAPPAFWLFVGSEGMVVLEAFSGTILKTLSASNGEYNTRVSCPLKSKST